MRILHRAIERSGEGSVKLRPEQPDDLWHAYHLITVGDQIRATTLRKVQKESFTGTVDAERVKIPLMIEVETIDFDPGSGMLRLTGKNVEENPYVKLGVYHTLELQLNRNFVLYKQHWDAVYLERLQQATDAKASAEVAAIVMQDGLAHVCLITGGMTLLRAKIEMAMPKKGRSSAASGSLEKSQAAFFDQVIKALLHHVELDSIKCVVIASPGFVKDKFFEYLIKDAQRRSVAKVLDNRAKFVLAHASSGYLQALNEALADPTVAPRIADTKAAAEVRALAEFNQMLASDPDRAVYGPEHVLRAHAHRAIQTLLVTDELFRSSDLKTRQQYVALVESVREAGADVKIFSSLHPSGEQLHNYSGIAAILYFPLPELPEEEEAAGPAAAAAAAATATGRSS